MSKFKVVAAEVDAVHRVRRELERLAGAPLPEWDAIGSTAVMCVGSPGDVLTLAAGDKPGINVVLSGLLRATVPTTNGRRRTYAFPAPGEVLAGLSFLALGARSLGVPQTIGGTGEPWPEDSEMTAVTPTTTMRFDGLMLLQLAERHLIWSNLVMRVVMHHLLNRTRRLYDQLALTPEERYVKTLREEAAVVRSISQRDLALYLGVTPEALSRIAARMRDRQRLDTGHAD